MSPLPIGKLPAEDLRRLLTRFVARDPRVLVGPALGEDAAVLQLGERCLVVSTDPITFATDRIGWYAVHVNANDVAVMGARPRWFLVTVLLPGGRADTDLVERIVADVASTCDALGITVCGGHTEVTAGIDRPIVVGQMIGEVPLAQLISKRLAPGDRILLTHGAAIEGTAILAREARTALSGLVGDDVLDAGARLLFTPGISVVDAALAAAETGYVRAMHDATEGGILTALFEIASAAGVGLQVDRRAIPVLPVTARLCDVLDLDPLRLIASGSLLLGVAPEGVQPVVAALARLDVPTAIVAEVCERKRGMFIEGPGRGPLGPADRDELARFFERNAG